MRVLISAESFVPEVNGVTNSVLQVLAHLDRRGHDAMVIAAAPGPVEIDGVPVLRVPGISLPRYRSLNVGWRAPARISEEIRRFRPDVVHLAAPVVLGAAVASAAARERVPSVAVFQTDLSGFVRDYGLGVAGRGVWAWLRRVHDLAELTLVPSSASAFDLRRHGIGPLAIWGRGVDSIRFHPARRDDALRRELSPDDRPIVGYVGRLASEKRVQHLAGPASLPGAHSVVIGDGPARGRLERTLDGTRFLGLLHGEQLAAAMASLDVFVHTGPHETFCQAIQEAMASGVPVIAPASGGPLDLVQHGRTGYLYPSAHPELLTAIAATLLGDRALRERMGSAARQAVEHRTWTALGDELLGHYETAIHASESHRGPTVRSGSRGLDGRGRLVRRLPERIA
ncbi:MAG: glycosyltransferase family 4 protein [Acidimicrobiales bacterium]